jgi:prepilin-type N-terminal cleavage/methylation domain-containing protein
LRLNRSAFTLIEVMIALMIISIALVALSSSQSIALNSTRKSRFVTMATVAAKNMMADIDVTATLKGFDYVKELGEKATGDFDQIEYKGWKWVREVKEVNFPISAIMKSYMGGGGTPEEGEGASSEATKTEGETGENALPQEAQMLNMVAKNVETFMKQSVREITVTVMWPVRGGKEFSDMKLVYYTVDYDAVQNFAPVM